MLAIRKVALRTRQRPWKALQLNTNYVKDKLLSLHLFQLKAYISTSSGMFQVPGLHKPQDFQHLTNDVKMKCQRLRTALLQETPGLKSLNLLDELSNTICLIVDTAELCRNVHPDAQYREAASKCFMELSDFVQRLNTDVSLYEPLRLITENKSLFNSFSDEDKRMTILLKQEFERDGIHLPPNKRERAVILQNEIVQLSSEFQRTIGASRDYVEIPAKWIRPLHSSVYSQCQRKWSNPSILLVPTDSHIMHAVLQYVRDPNIRKEMYIKANQCAKENIFTLQKLLTTRHALARNLGFPTYAHFAMNDRMLKSPNDVERILRNWARSLQPKAQGEYNLLLSTKQRMENSDASQVHMWDVPYYTGYLKAKFYSVDSTLVSEYFPLQNCIQGLSILSKELFGLELRPVEPEVGEIWHPEVTKLELMHENKSLGTIYMDLFPRANKYGHAAHFTIRCAKNRKDGKSRQSPIVALVCNFSRPHSKSQPSLLSHAELKTLFHEFGHALHSLVSQTSYQHLSGTRCPLDFVETPSHLIESFVWEYDLISQFARHYKTGETIPQDMLEKLKKSRTMFSAMDDQTQCLYAVFDLSLHDDTHNSIQLDSCQRLHDLQNEMTLIPHVDQTHWHARFGHLIGYGAGYYGYFFARMFASDIMETCFAKGKTDFRLGGERVYKELLIHGGAKDPMEMLKNVSGGNINGKFSQQLGLI